MSAERLICGMPEAGIRIALPRIVRCIYQKPLALKILAIEEDSVFRSSLRLTGVNLTYDCQSDGPLCGVLLASSYAYQSERWLWAFGRRGSFRNHRRMLLTGLCLVALLMGGAKVAEVVSDLTNAGSVNVLGDQESLAAKASELANIAAACLQLSTHCMSCEDLQKVAESEALASPDSVDLEVLGLQFEGMVRRVLESARLGSVNSN